MAPWASTLLALSTVLVSKTLDGFDAQTLSNVRARLLESAQQSWELGTAAEALTEFSWPSLSVFHNASIPPPSHLSASDNATDVLNIANKVVTQKPLSSLALVANDGAAGDPASIGVSVLLANWTRPDLSNTIYSTAAGEQLTYLLNYAPRTDQGAISHRTDQVQLWADSVYMVPPFIAYFGALGDGGSGPSLFQIAYDQCRLYREQLRDEGGLWRHVALGDWQDNTHWATGNGWAAAGMLRVRETMNHSSLSSDFAGHQANLTSWVQEILNATWQFQNDDGSLLNVIDDPYSFTDSASTALLASVTYRLAAITNDTTLIPNANAALNFTRSNIDEHGWLQNTVDPYTFNSPIPPGDHSPEGQAFILLLHSAWRDLA